MHMVNQYTRALTSWRTVSAVIIVLLLLICLVLYVGYILHGIDDLYAKVEVATWDKGELLLKIRQHRVRGTKTVLRCESEDSKGIMSSSEFVEPFATPLEALLFFAREPYGTLEGQFPVEEASDIQWYVHPGDELEIARGKDVVIARFKQDTGIAEKSGFVILLRIDNL